MPPTVLRIDVPAMEAPAPSQPQAANSSHAAGPTVSVDEALQSIARDETQAVVPALPQLITRLLPLLRLLSARQRTQLVSYLQKLGV